jgi:hypothetical protein
MVLILRKNTGTILPLLLPASHIRAVEDTRDLTRALRYISNIIREVTAAEMIKRFEILMAYNATRGCECTWDLNAAYTLWFSLP